MFKAADLFAGYHEREVLRGISIGFQEGKATAILGPNGSGKSTFLRVLDRILKPYKGAVYFDGKRLESFTRKQIARSIAYLPQMTNTVPFCTVFEAVLLGRKPYISLEPGEGDLEIVEEIIKEIGLEELAFRKIHELSGGELQKVLIARALAQKPHVLLLDEPVSHLDMRNQLEILGVLKDVTQKQNLINITVFHDLNLALMFNDYFVFMKNGEIYREGGAEIITPSLIKEVYDVDAEIMAIDNRRILVFAYPGIGTKKPVNGH
jgi:iron complex transport system ATP-binding protein